jgi:cell shape-determining protein MreD
MWAAGGRLPLLMIPFALSVAAFETPVRSAVYACICGLILDNLTGSLFGFFGITLLWCALFVSVLFTLLLRRHILNVFLLNAAASALLLFARYFFYISIWDYDSGGTIFLDWYVPMFFLTAVAGLPSYLLVRLCKTKLVHKTELTLEEKSDDIVRE